ncbi:uncharacterized protein TNCV_1085151 [Trichonephila clavipes]|nr:uncharacterized protein TNCV_1085151 [Trichonephila clavipes]
MKKENMQISQCNALTDGDRFNSCPVIYSQFGLAIHPNDHQARRRFVEWAQNEIAAVPDFHKRILFRDEAHFWLNGYVNKQNCCIWSEANPQVYVETPLHPEKLTVWCALWELWFQQDGTTCHTARATIDLLKDTFGNRLISRFGPVNWPPRSCDLTPLDYFLWGYVKSLVYARKPQTLDHLEDNIRRVIADIRPQMLEKVIENWTSRLDYIRASRGSPMPEIIFKMKASDDSETENGTETARDKTNREMEIGKSDGDNRKRHEEHKPRLPDSIAQPITNMPLSRMENTTFAKPSIIDSHDMGLRTVYSPDAQKKTPIQLYKLHRERESILHT